MTDPRSRVWVAIVGVLLLAVAAGASIDQSVVDRLTGRIRRAVAAENRPPTESVLLAMREMRDQRLRPLFAGLALRDEPAAKLHGIFGLAELSDDGTVSIAQISGITNESLRALILGRAIGGDYLEARQMRQVLNWPELDPGLELLVTSKLMQMGEDVDVVRLREIADQAGEERLASRIFALLLVAQLEDDSGASEVTAVLDGLDPRVRVSQLAFALAQIQSEKLVALRDFVVEAHETIGGQRQLRLQSLATLLLVDPALGRDEWTAAYDGEDDLASRIRLGLVLLGAVARLEPEAFDPMVGDEFELLDAMGRAGRAVAAAVGEPRALLDLFSHLHAPTISWGLATLETLEPPRRIGILREILAMATPREDPQAPVPAYLYEVVRLLEAAEPGATGPVLADACARPDTPLCEAMLAAINDTDPHVAWDPDDEPAWPGGKALVLAVIAEARAGLPLTSEELDLLISAGTGGETLPPAFTVQAAWLALCQLDLEREALAKILAPPSE